MAVPLIIAGAIGLWGVKKGLDARSNFARANEIVENARFELEQAQSRLKLGQERLAKGIISLGKLKIVVLDSTLKRVMEAWKRLNIPAGIKSSGPAAKLGEIRFGEIARDVDRGVRLARVGPDGLRTGVLAGFGAAGMATGFATTFGVASTGTAIGTLSGAAATNATLAWFGGGSLAAGGLGVAGGAAAIGGIVAAPLIAVMGAKAAAKSEEALTQAEAYAAKLMRPTERLANIGAIVHAGLSRVEEVQSAITRLNDRLESELRKLERTIAEKESRQVGWKWRVRRVLTLGSRRTITADMLSKEEISLVLRVKALTVAIHRLMKVKILDRKGKLIKKSEKEIDEVLGAAQAI